MTRSLRRHIAAFDSMGIGYLDPALFANRRRPAVDDGRRESK
jgi:hypothetical protein